MKDSDEPRVVPYPGIVHGPLWYCLECGADRPNEYAIANHWGAQHCDPPNSLVPDNGVDYAEGFMLLRMQERRGKWIEEQAKEFAATFHPGFGPDDFVAESEIRDA